MKFDVIIIGGGLSGLTAGIALAEAGKEVALVSAGQNSLHFGSGSFDLLILTRKYKMWNSWLNKRSNSSKKQR